MRTYFNRLILIIFLANVGYGASLAQINYDKDIPIKISIQISRIPPVNTSEHEEYRMRQNEGWLFLRQDLGSIWEAVRPYSKGTPESVPIWTEVTLPHCFNAEDAVDASVNYYQGPGWYKKMLHINNRYPKGRTLLQFEGAGQKTDVYIHTQKVASHVGGYDEWQADITDAVDAFRKSEDAKRFEGKVPLIIRCDNSRDTEMIPSDLSDFNLYGGIYRYLNLVYTPQIALSGLHTDARVDAQGKEGSLSITTEITNHLLASGKASINIAIYDPNGKIIEQRSEQIDTKSIKNLSHSLSIKVKKPILWSTDAPNLYTCVVSLTTPEGEVMASQERFGFRHFEFVAKGPFLLNGKRLLLRGTHRHEDHAGLAAAMTEDLIVKEMQMMKDMGVNFIRLGHYQQSRIVLQQCDKLGILVWEEIPWCRGGLGGKTYQDQAKQMLSNMITQHRNHPSIILWGMGNENDWPNDFPEFDKEKIRAFMKELHDLSHQMDDTRLTAIRRCDFCKDIIDVYSPSIWAGWYRGIYTDYKKVSLEEMQKTDRFLHVEWGGDSHAGRHAENTYEGLNDIKRTDSADERAGDASLYGGIARASKDGDWSESYICDLIDWHLKEQETMEWLTGAAYWPFKDFSTPVRPENPVPYMNQKGVVERDLTPKESFYVFQSYWSNKPMVHIYGHSWPTRWGKPGEEKIIKIYSNCEQVELVLNGKSLGKKYRNSQDFPAAGLRWNTAFVEGRNTLEAIAHYRSRDGATMGKSGSEKTVRDEISFDYETRTFGKPTQIKVVTTPIDDDNTVWIEAQLQDENGVPCLDSRDYIYFDMTGDGQLAKHLGTSSGSSKVQALNGRAKIKLIKHNGESVVSIRSDGLKTVFATVK